MKRRAFSCPKTPFLKEKKGKNFVGGMYFGARISASLAALCIIILCAIHVVNPCQVHGPLSSVVDKRCNKACGSKRPRAK